MSTVDLIAIALAAGAPINAWLHTTSVLSSFREHLSVKLEAKHRHLLGDLLNCRFCLSYWLPAILIALFYAPSLFLDGAAATACKLPIYSLAATRLTLLISYVASGYRSITGQDVIDNAE